MAELNNRRPNLLNEELKRREAARKPDAAHDGEPLALDDTQRVKVLSPGRLVAKRFFRNKLAIVGLAILIFMFVFAFLGPLFYPYSQTEIFYKYDLMNVNYASATKRTEFVSYALDGAPEVHYSVRNRMNSYITQMVDENLVELSVADSDGVPYRVVRASDEICLLYSLAAEPVGTYYGSAVVANYDSMLDSFTWQGGEQSVGFQEAARAAVSAGAGGFTLDGLDYTLTSTRRNQYEITRGGSSYAGESPDEGFQAAVEQNLEAGSFEYAGSSWRVTANGDGSYEVARLGGEATALVSSTLVFHAFDVENAGAITDSLRAAALLALGRGESSFTHDGTNYTIADSADGPVLSDAAGEQLALLSTFAIRRYSGQDTLSIEYKEAAQACIEEMIAGNRTTGSFTAAAQRIDEEGNYQFDETGAPIVEDTTFTVTYKDGSYTLVCEQITYLIDRYAGPSSAHPFGTDGDGMDLLARMMYGGRISLMVGFVVVLLEIVIGVVMGGLAGYFGGWVDTLVMRLVDVFYCIPSYPILIIMGAFFDAIKMDPYTRLVWMMAILGILGWAAVARLVRGQILSLREQEFMIAQEATGMRARRRIFRHLVPNVMPQLIVNATMGLGSVIIMESTLSFLGLGVKHPRATWGTMINSVTSSSENMIRYTYIWVPVGLLICLTVIAFNFVGDGLRDAFDPKMKQ